VIARSRAARFVELIERLKSKARAEVLEEVRRAIARALARVRRER
jgi:hypothetical protein